MPTSFEDALGMFQDKEGLNRSGALERIKRLAAAGYEEVLAIPNLKEGIEKEEKYRRQANLVQGGPGQFLQGMASGVFSGGVRPFAKLGEMLGVPGAGELYEEALAGAEYQPSQGGRLVGEIGGSFLPQGVASKAVAATGLVGRAAGALSGLSQASITAIRAGKLTEGAAKLSEAVLSKANTIEKGLDLAVQSGIGAFTSPENPLMGAGLFAGTTLVTNLLGKSGVSGALQYIARAQHASIEQVQANWAGKTLSELRGEMQKAGAPRNLLADLEETYADVSAKDMQPTLEPTVPEDSPFDWMRKINRGIGPQPKARFPKPEKMPGRPAFAFPKREGIIEQAVSNQGLTIAGQEVAPGKILNIMRPIGTVEGSGVTAVKLNKPLVVDVPQGEISHDAVIRALYGNTKEADQVVKLTETSGIPKETEVYNSILDEFIRRKGIERGYDGVVIRSNNPLNDITYHFKGMPKLKLKPVDELIRIARKVVQHSADETVGAAIKVKPGTIAAGIGLPLMAVGALLGVDMLAPEQAQALPARPIEEALEIAAKLGLKGAEDVGKGIVKYLGLKIPEANYSFVAKKGEVFFNPGNIHAETMGAILERIAPSTGVMDRSILGQAFDQGYVRVTNGSTGLNLEFNPLNDEAVETAKEVVMKNWRKDKVVYIDVESEFGYTHYNGKYRDSIIDFIDNKWMDKLSPDKPIPEDVIQAAKAKLRPIEVQMAETEAVAKKSGERFKAAIDKATPRALKGEKGAVGDINTPKRQPGPVPGTFLEYDPASKSMILMADSHMEEALLKGDDGVGEVVGMWNTGPKWALSLRPVWGASEDKRYLGYVRRMFNSKDEILGRKLDAYRKRGQALIDDYGIGDKAKSALTKIDYDDFIDAVSKTKRGADGAIIFEKGINEAHKEVAGKFRDMEDELWTLVTGVDARVPAMFEDRGVEYSKRELMKVRQLQDYLYKGIGKPPKRLDQVHYDLAKKTQGFIGYDGSHDLSVLYKQGHFAHLPHEKEEALLVERIAELTQQSKFMGDNRDTIAAIKGLTARLEGVRKVRVDLQAGRGRATVSGVLPNKQGLGPLGTAKDPTAAHMLWETNVPHIMSREITGILAKRYFDVTLTDAKQLLKQLDDKDLQTYIVNHLNAQRGLRGYNEDRWLAAAVDYIGSWVGRDPDRAASMRFIQKSATQMMKFNYVTRIALSPLRFPLLNGTQTALTVAPVTGVSNWLRAWGMIRDAKAWEEVRELGLITNMNRSIFEIEELVPSKMNTMMKALSFLPNKSEDMNKFVAYHAGKLAALEDGFKPLMAMKTYMPTGATRLDRAKEYARAVVDHTQFRYGPEARPLAWSGGFTRRVAGQFKTFPTMYASLLANLVKEAKHTGNYKPILTAGAALGLFGGIPAIAGAVPGASLLIDQLRGPLLKHGYRIPEQTGLGLMANWAGFGNSPIDLTFAMDPFNLPQISADKGGSLGNIASFIGGPVVGAGVQLWNPGSLPKRLLRAAAPGTFSIPPFPGAAGAEALSQYQMGGLRSPSGELQVRQNIPDLLARAFNLRPSARMQRYQYAQDIEYAMSGGQGTLVRELIQEAKEKGFYFGPKAMASIKARVEKGRKDSHRKGPVWEKFQ